MASELIEQVRGDNLVINTVLSSSIGVWNYDPQAPSHLSVMAIAPGRSEEGVANFTVRPLNAGGAVQITIPNAELPDGADEFDLIVFSPLGSFYGEKFRVHFTSAPIDSEIGTLKNSLATLTSTVASLSTNLNTKLDTLILPVEGNVKREYEWNEDGTEIVACNLLIVSDDNAADFTNPDKKYRIEYVRHESSRRVISSTMKEVAV
jgi:hypothetical protein